ncbi:MAG: hypothetical protein U9O95_06480 [Candidatus Marinimicrobia bacterium]|nr:hypothetical protein [Candidatus Neomarinimicrobiota bacterium]
MTYHKSEMYYNDYQWLEPGKDTRVVQATVFQPDNGNTILYMINSLTQNLLDSKILEIIIHEFVPNTIKTVKQAFEWIRKQGDHYYKVVLRSIVKNS